MTGPASFDANVMRSASLVLVLLALTPARPVHADGRPSLLVDHQQHELPIVLDLELGATTHAEDSVVTSTFGLRFPASRSVDLELAMPLLWLNSDAPSGAREGVHTGNLSTAVSYVEAEDDSYIRIGAALVLPASSLDDDAGFGDSSGSGLASAMRGGQSAYLYLPESLGVVLPIRSEKRYGAGLVGAELKLGAFGAGGALLAVTELAVTAAGHIGPLLTGASLQLAWLPLLHNDNAFLSLAPFAQLDLSQAISLHARFVLNLNEPWGVAGANVWGAFIGAALRLW